MSAERTLRVSLQFIGTSSARARLRLIVTLSLAAAPGFALFVIHGLRFGGWLIDDAGISFAYARNLAAGAGLVAQAGHAPVEGFSNPLWTLLIALLTYLKVF